MDVDVGTVLYRYVDFKVYGAPARGILEEYKVVKRTQCGVWIVLFRYGTTYLGPGWSLRRFMYLNTKNKFAHLDKKAALYSYIMRKRRQLEILQGQVEKAVKCLQWAEGEYGSSFEFDLVDRNLLEWASRRVDYTLLD